MDKTQIANSVACCGLICGLCSTVNKCSCRLNNHCSKRLSPQGCYQYECCSRKGIDGCWQCDKAPCGIDMLAPGKVKMRAFIRCIKEDGIDKFSEYIVRNADSGVVYHRKGVKRDYDLSTEEDVLMLLRNVAK